MKKRILYAGPWTGEFGWELLHWQAYLRKQAEKFDRVIVSSFPGREALYEDYADEFIPHKIKGTPNFNGMKKGPISSKPKTEHTTWIRTSPSLWIGREEQKFIKYGRRNPINDFKVLIHARNTSRGTWKNQSPDFWTKVRKMLPPEGVVSIGLKKEALYIPGTIDLRNLDLGKLMRIMAGAEFIIGGSSGPMHLAALCGCPQIVWGGGCKGRHSLEMRYLDSWNPFKTRCEFIKARHWLPDLGELKERISRIMAWEKEPEGVLN